MRPVSRVVAGSIPTAVGNSQSSVEDIEFGNHKSPEVTTAQDLEDIPSDRKVVSGVDAIKEHLGKEDEVYFCKVCDITSKTYFKKS